MEEEYGVKKFTVNITVYPEMRIVPEFIIQTIEKRAPNVVVDIIKAFGREVEDVEVFIEEME